MLHSCYVRRLGQHIAYCGLHQRRYQRYRQTLTTEPNIPRVLCTKEPNEEIANAQCVGSFSLVIEKKQKIAIAAKSQ
jgi:hypothetical protein